MYFPDFLFHICLDSLTLPCKYNYCLSETVLIRKRLYLPVSQLKYLGRARHKYKREKKIKQAK